MRDQSAQGGHRIIGVPDLLADAEKVGEGRELGDDIGVQRAFGQTNNSASACDPSPKGVIPAGPKLM